jgi:mannitol-1-phosphate 5-dehydrogenase
MRGKEVVIIGAGKIGRGFLTDLFTEAGYRPVFVNGSTDTVDKLRKAGRYTIFTTENNEVRRKAVTDFEAYSSRRDFDDVVERLSEIDLACVALYPEAYDSVADVIAGAIRLRRKNGVTDPLNVLFFVNLVFVSDILREKLLEQLTDAADRAYFESHVGLVEALTARNGSVPTKEMLEEDPLCVSTGPGYKLPVGDNFVGEKPSDIPSMEFLDRMQGRLVRKVWCGNMGHCFTAALGQRFGCSYIYECAEHEYIRKCVDYAASEACFGVGKRFGFTHEEMRASGVLRRNWEAQLKSRYKDTIERVAADPLRKLARNDRFIGPALLCMQYGRLPYYLARGAAYLMFFENNADPSCVKMHEIIKELGIERAVYALCELDRKVEAENTLAQLILAQYREILSHDPDPMTL